MMMDSTILYANSRKFLAFFACLLTILRLLAMSVLVADTPLPLKVDARLNTPYHEVVTGRESKISAVGNSFVDMTFGASVAANTRTPTKTVVPTSTDAPETKPTGSVTFVSESTDVLPISFLQSSMSTQVVIPVTLIEMTSAMPAQAMWTATVTWATWTATVARVATGIATHTAVGLEPSSPLLDRLVRNKPSIWGNKGFYVLSGVLYLTLLGLFLKQIIGPFKRQS